MVITVSGENAFGLQAELRRLIADFIAEHGDMALERVDGEEADYARINEALTSLPFLASKKMVVLRSGSANKQFAEQAEKLLADLPETTDLVLVEPKLDKRSSYYKLLKNQTDFREFAELDNRGLAKWLAERAKEQGGNLSLGDATFLVERVGASQQLLANELDKLVLYNPRITRETIELLTEETPQSKIFDLLDAAFAGNRARTFEIYEEQRALKVEPQQIIAMLAWQLHIFALVKAAGQREPDEIAKAAKLNPFVVRKAMTATRKLSGGDIRGLIERLLAIDSRLKRESLDPDEALKHYFLTVGK